MKFWVVIILICLSASFAKGADSMIVVKLKKWTEQVSISPLKGSIWYEKPETFLIERELKKPMKFSAAGAKIRISGNRVTLIPLNVGNCHLRIMDSLTGKTLKKVTWQIKYIPDGQISINGVTQDSVIDRLTLIKHGQLEYALNRPYTGIVDTFCLVKPNLIENRMDSMWGFQGKLTPPMIKYISNLPPGSALVFQQIRIGIFPGNVRRQADDLRVFVMQNGPYRFEG